MRSSAWRCCGEQHSIFFSSNCAIYCLNTKCLMDFSSQSLYSVNTKHTTHNKQRNTMNLNRTVERTQIKSTTEKEKKSKRNVRSVWRIFFIYCYIYLLPRLYSATRLQLTGSLVHVAVWVHENVCMESVVVWTALYLRLCHNQQTNEKKSGGDRKFTKY